MAEEVFLLARLVRTFGTEEKETGRYRRCLSMLRRISIRQATAYLFYLVTNASLFNLTKVCLPAMHPQHAHERNPLTLHFFSAALCNLQHQHL